MGQGGEEVGQEGGGGQGGKHGVAPTPCVLVGRGHIAGESDLRKQSMVPERHEAVHERRGVPVQRLDEAGRVLEEQREPRR